MKGINYFVLLVLLIVISAIVFTGCDNMISNIVTEETSVTFHYDLVSGVYAGPQVLTIICEPIDAKVKYTTDNSDPKTSSTAVFGKTIIIDKTMTVKVYVYYDDDDGFSSISTELSYVINGKTNPPQISPAAGTYYEPQTVKLVPGGEAYSTIYYTTDGSDPKTSSTAKIGGLIYIDATTTVKAYAENDTYLSSDVIEAVYTIIDPLGAPVFDPVPGLYTQSQTVTLTSTVENALITYTTDGSDPITSSTAVTGASVVVDSTTTIKAYAHNDDHRPSSISEGEYIITGTVPDPIISVGSGAYNTVVNVNLSVDMEGASIKYTLDGSDPKTSTTARENTWATITSSTTLKAYAYLENWNDSNVVEATYTLTPPLYYWTNTFGNENTESVADMFIDNDNTIFLTGGYRGTVDFHPADKITHTKIGASNTDYIYLSKVFDDGFYRDTTTIEGSGLVVRSLTGDGNSALYVVGKYTFGMRIGGVEIDSYIANDQDDIFIAKFDDELGLIRLMSLGGANDDSAWTATVDTGNNLYVAGQFMSDNLNFNPDGTAIIKSPNGLNDAFIIKYSDQGEVLWVKVMGYGNTDTITQMCTDSENNVYIAGTFSGTYDFNTDGTSDIKTSQGMNDVYLTKFTSSGDYCWTKTFGGAGSDYIDELMVDGSDNIYLAGTFYENAYFDIYGTNENKVAFGYDDIFITKINDDDSYAWTSVIGSSLSRSSEYVVSLSTDLSNNIYVYGLMGNTMTFYSPLLYTSVDTGESYGGMFISRLTNNGMHEWTKTICDYSGTGYPRVMEVDNENSIVYSGLYSGSNFDLNPGDIDPLETDNYTSDSGSFDVFLSKILQ